MSSGFVTESEVAEARKKRQEEWEKVRQPDEPMERPEEPYDGRSLYERLKEQRDKKDLEFEETHKLKNLIRGLDDDEINFLDIVDKAKMEAEKRQQIQEKNELSEFRQRVASLQEQTIDKKISIESAISKPKTPKPPARQSQKSILAGAVRKRAATDDIDGKQPSKDEVVPAKVNKTNDNTTSSVETNGNQNTGQSENSTSTSNTIDLSVHNKGALKCVGILPGIGRYNDSSDSEKSTDTDDDYDFSDFDWIGRKVKKNHDDSCDE
ncbi:PSME3-interacting protein [Contarinia nasturtii]|uniref:PSME3-interacting protein n=1 Tax=Contarinia nasturtii TaxID=265458 RepID=UPI0012D47A9D|nr:PSME3-interacting protein [Contarinia nasturtii]